MFYVFIFYLLYVRLWRDKITRQDSGEMRLNVALTDFET